MIFTEHQAIVARQCSVCHRDADLPRSRVRNRYRGHIVLCGFGFGSDCGNRDGAPREPAFPLYRECVSRLARGGAERDCRLRTRGCLLSGITYGDVHCPASRVVPKAAFLVIDPQVETTSRFYRETETGSDVKRCAVLPNAS